MERFSVIIPSFVVATIVLAIAAASGIFAVKADVPHGVISIAFDDNYIDQYDYAFPLLQVRGITGTFYAVKNQLRDFSFDSSYMSIAELKELQDNGNEIGSHSVTHTTFTYLSDNQIRQECSESKQILEDNGLVVANFAYPNGVTNDHIDSIVDDYYRSGRTAYVAPYLMDVPTSQFRLAGFSEEPGDLVALKNMVDQVYSTNSWAIIFFHHVHDYGGEYTTSTQVFGEFLDYIISKGVQTLTVNQVLDLADLTPLSMDANFGTVTPTSGLYNLGDTINIEAFSPNTGDGERYVWLGWSGSGLGSYTGTDNPAVITLNGPVNQTASWRHEYKLTVSSNLGATTPSAGEHWYEAGTSVNIKTSAPSAGTGERYVCTWTGTGSGSYSGVGNSASIVMNEAITESALWVQQFQVSVGLSGVGSDFSGGLIVVDGTSYAGGASFWWDSGSSHSYEFISALSVGDGKRYMWVSGSGLSSQLSGSITVSSSGALTGEYKTQYYVDVISVHGVVGGAGWYDSGATAYASLDEAVVHETSDVRYVFKGWSDAASGTELTSDAIEVNGAMSAVASWEKQFLVAFDQIGLPSDNNISIIVNSTNHNLPFSIWVNEGDSVQFVYPSGLDGGFGVSYVLTFPLNQSLSGVDSPATVTARYDMQYGAELFAVIVVPTAVLILVKGISVLRKRRSA